MQPHGCVGFYEKRLAGYLRDAVVGHRDKDVRRLSSGGTCAYDKAGHGERRRHRPFFAPGRAVDHRAGTGKHPGESAADCPGAEDVPALLLEYAHGGDVIEYQPFSSIRSATGRLSRGR